MNNGGLILTEYLPDQKPSQENFVRRNRIQAALSDVLIPVEWSLKSGTSHTVKYAAQLKEQYFALYLGSYCSGRNKIRPIRIFSHDNEYSIIRF